MKYFKYSLFLHLGEKVTAKSKKVSLFETPYGKSYFCPAQEVILLYRDGEQHAATVHLKEIHVQAYDVEDGKFSSSKDFCGTKKFNVIYMNN